MKLFRMLGRSIRDAFKSVIRNFSLSLASISCITITLIIVALAIIASFNVQNFTKEIERDMTIVVFVDTKATEEEVSKMIAYSHKALSDAGYKPYYLYKHILFVHR